MLELKIYEVTLDHDEKFATLWKSKRSERFVRRLIDDFAQLEKDVYNHVLCRIKETFTVKDDEFKSGLASSLFTLDEKIEKILNAYIENKERHIPSFIIKKHKFQIINREAFISYVINNEYIVKEIEALKASSLSTSKEMISLRLVIINDIKQIEKNLLPQDLKRQCDGFTSSLAKGLFTHEEPEWKNSLLKVISNIMLADCKYLALASHEIINGQLIPILKPLLEKEISKFQNKFSSKEFVSSDLTSREKVYKEVATAILLDVGLRRQIFQIGNKILRYFRTELENPFLSKQYLYTEQQGSIISIKTILETDLIHSTKQLKGLNYLLGDNEQLKLLSISVSLNTSNGLEDSYKRLSTLNNNRNSIKNGNLKQDREEHQSDLIASPPIPALRLPNIQNNSCSSSACSTPSSGSGRSRPNTPPKQTTPNRLRPPSALRERTVVGEELKNVSVKGLKELHELRYAKHHSPRNATIAHNRAEQVKRLSTELGSPQWQVKVQGNKDTNQSIQK